MEKKTQLEETDQVMTKILGKIMQSSYKKKEIAETVDRIIKKIESRIINTYDEATIKSLRLEFEEIRKNLYNI